jgi:hypothetical protein
MLPSVRLMFTTFLVGFVVVFAGLRVATLTRISHDSLPGLATPVVAAPRAPLASMMPPPPPIASVPADDPPRVPYTVPVMFNLESVISATAVAPPPAPIEPDMASIPAELAPLPLLPGIAQSEPEAKPISVEVAAVPADLTPRTIRPENALQSVPAMPVEAPPAVAEPQPTPVVEVKAGEPVRIETPAAAPQPLASEPLMAAASDEGPATTQVAGLVEPDGLSSPALASMDALTRLAEPPPVTVLIRLPLPKKPPLVTAQAKTKAKAKAKTKTKTVSAKRLWPVRQAGARDPFSLTFGDPLRPF